MKVTFDSNVWESLVQGNKDMNQIIDLIKCGKIEPYICEIALSLESISKANRLPFHLKYKPSTEFIEKQSTDKKYHYTIKLSPNNNAHPGLHPKLITGLTLAYKLGFKVLTMTNFGTVRNNEIPKDMLISFDKKDDFWSYADRLSECSKYIETLGAGAARYHELKAFLYNTGKKRDQITSEVNYSKSFHKAVAEWVDGESLAAHYAYGNDIFCTNDRGRNAGQRSIFNPKILKKVSKKFNLNILSSHELSGF